MSPFLIVGLPRSRTAWLAAFLTNGDVFCHHEGFGPEMSFDSLWAKLNVPGRITGDADPALCHFPEFVGDISSHAIVVTVTRPEEEVREALTTAYAGTNFETTLVMASAVPGFRAIRNMGFPNFNYHELGDTEFMKRLFSTILPGREFPAERWELFRHLNIQQNVASRAATLV